jgi:glutamyl-tRNA synthetase
MGLEIASVTIYIMYSNELIEKLTALLAPNGYTPRAESEAAYPVRILPTGAEVMRVPPSPTGFVHIGTIYAGLVNERIAHQSGGVFILRIEDTDKKREITGSVDQIIEAFKAFGLNYDEGPNIDATYGPYFQSQRGKIYMGYALELLKNGRAYPCFATSDELQAATKDQQAKKQRPGYYGDWALWRDKSEAEILAALDAGLPFVLRFKSLGDHQKRIAYSDIFKGKMEVPENDLDVPLIKSDEYRLPTYHLAHVVDDHLMRVTKVFRSDEWLPSTALHIELAQALNIEPFSYGHFAPISIIDKNGGGKRKLSKRKDDEADVQFWLKAGYPIEGVKAYLLGLANSNFEEWYRANPDKSLGDFPVSIEKLAASRSPLLDLAKMEDYSKDYIANLSQDNFVSFIHEWAELNAPYLVDAVSKDKDYAEKVFAVERDGDKPRKDLTKWSDVPEQYGYFFDELFGPHFATRINDELKDLDSEAVANACKEFLATYDEKDDQQTWFDKLKAAAEQTGFAIDNKAYKETPEKFKGNVADFARIIRVKLTGKNRTPDLWTIMRVMGRERIAKRLGC